jgi:Tfp pilus assembly protein PilF
LAILRYQQGKFGDAEELYRRALQQGQANAITWNNLAWILAHFAGKETEALQLVDRAIDWGGPTPALLDTRATAQLALGKADLAITDLNAAIAAEPMSPVKYFHLAQAYQIAKKPDTARAMMRRSEALGLKPDGVDPIERSAFERLASELGQP